MTSPIDPDIAPAVAAFEADYEALKTQYAAVVGELTTAQAALSTNQATITELEGQVTSLEASLTAAAASIAEANTNEQAMAQQVPRLPWLGCYHGGAIPGDADDAATKASFGAYPDVSSTYIQPQAITAQLQTNIAAQIANGISPLLTLTSKVPPSTITIPEIAAQTSAAVAYVDSYLAMCDTLSRINPAIPVRINMDHEPEVGINAKPTAYPNTTDAQIAAAATYFIYRARVKAPLCKVVLWFGAFDQTQIAAILTGIMWAPDAMSFDPYDSDAHPVGETFIETMTPIVTFIRANLDYIRLGSPELWITEFGIGTEKGDAVCAKWLAGSTPGGLRADMATLGIAGGVFFDRNNPDYLIDSGNFPLSCAAFTASLHATATAH